MRFQNEGSSGDIQDRRGMSAGAVGGLGLGGVAVVVVASLLLGINPLRVLGMMNGSSAPTSGVQGQGGGPRNAGEAQAERLVRAATTDIQNFWTQALPQQAGRQYPRTQLVLFADAVRSGCGMAEAQTGPFFCPADRLVYIDLSFYDELARRFRAPGQFAQAYVLAHEFGHHVQNTLGIESRVRQYQQARPDMRNALSVMMELQADCLAGVWGSSAAQRGMLDPGEVEQGLAAAAAIGDDRIQRSAGRRVSPESFTHGSSEQRVMWFRRGMSTGQINQCDTFGNGTLAP